MHQNHLELMVSLTPMFPQPPWLQRPNKLSAGSAAGSSAAEVNGRRKS
jgi:hypothetical protein